MTITRIALMTCLMMVEQAGFRAVAADADCPVQATWLKGLSFDTSEPNNPTTNDCGFYQRAWQAFLAISISNASSKGARFIDFADPSQIFPAPSASLSNSFPLKRSGRLSVSLRLSKEMGPLFHEGISQADGSILVARNGRPIFYAIHMDQKCCAICQRQQSK